MKERMVFTGRPAALVAAIAVIGLLAVSVAWAGAQGSSDTAVVGVQDEDGERTRIRREVRKEVERAVARLEAALEEMREGELEIAQDAVEDALAELRELEEAELGPMVAALAEMEPMAWRLHRSRELGERIRERVRDDVRGHLRSRWMPHHGRLALLGSDHGDGFLLAFADELELTDEQVEQIERMRDRHRREAIERRAEAEVAKLDLHDLKEEAETDLAAVEAKMRELADLRIEGELSRLRMRRQIRDLLTEEQRQELEELRRGPRRFFFGSGPGHAWDGPSRPLHWRFREECREDDR